MLQAVMIWNGPGAKSGRARNPEPEAQTRRREAAGSRHYRPFYMGLIHEDGTLELALRRFARHTPDMGIMDGFHCEDHRLDDVVARPKRVGINRLRTRVTGTNGWRPGGWKWAKRPVARLANFDRTVAFCFTPDCEGISPHHSSPPKDPMYVADFCARTIERRARGTEAKAAG